MTSEFWKPRKLEILQCLAQGLTNNEIAARLHLSQETIRWYNKQIFRKLGATNRTQAVQLASEQNLLKGQEGNVAVKRSNGGKVRYVSNNGIHIAYQVIGNGPVDVLFIHGFLSNLELAWEDAEYTSFFEQMGKFARVILFDKRGMGLSDRVEGAPSLEDTMSDALCVLDTAASNRTFVMGTSEGGAASVLLAATQPERVRGLILYSSTPKLVQTNNEPSWADDEKTFAKTLERIQQEWGGPWAIQNFAPSRAQKDAFREWWAKVLRSSTSPSGASDVLRVLHDIDIRPLLPQIHTRTLVIHKTHDRILPADAGRYIASHMPNARYAELPGADHFFFINCAETLSEISKFVQEETDETADTWIGIVLYANLPNLKEKENFFQAGLKEYRATGIFYSNEEATAVFDSPSRAIQCALKLQALIKEDSLRISLHVGECSVANGKPAQVVIDAARHAAEFSPQRKVILTQTLRDILAGSGVVFDLHQIYIDGKKSESLSLYELTNRPLEN